MTMMLLMVLVCISLFDSTNIFNTVPAEWFLFLFLFSLNFVFSEGTPGCITPWKMILSSNLYVVFVN